MSPEMTQYLKLVSDKVASNVKVVTGKDLGIGCLLHISTNPKIPEFIPMVSTRTMNAEDRTVPRVCTAPTIVGCLNGYQAQIKNFHDQLGLTIYGIPFDEALIPSTKLLPDVKMTDEVWLVPYSKKYSGYKPNVIGRMFAYTVKWYSSKCERYDIEFYVEVLEDFMFSPTVSLKVGLWRLTLVYDSSVAANKQEIITVAPLTKAEYVAAKRSGEVQIKHPEAPSSKW